MVGNLLKTKAYDKTYKNSHMTCLCPLQQFNTCSHVYMFICPYLCLHYA